jgi:hypothetical protein
MPTTGTDCDWQFARLGFGEVNRGTGYQSTLDDLLKPSDDGFSGCLQNWPDRDEFSGDLGLLIGFAEVAFSC